MSFGLVKRLYNKTTVDCLQDIVPVVEQSSAVNLCGTENVDVIVTSFGLYTFLATFFCKIVNIKKFHHFHFDEGSTTLRVQEFPHVNPQQRQEQWCVKVKQSITAAYLNAHATRKIYLTKQQRRKGSWSSPINER